MKPSESGGARVTSTHENQIMFRDVTPGRYVIQGNPTRPCHQQSKPVNIELKPGQASRITLPAKP